MIKILLCMLASLTFWGCDLGNTGNSQVVTLEGQMPSTETGTATLTDLGNNTTQVAITTSAVTDTGVQSAAIYTGTCAANGTVFALLNNLQADQSITTVSSPLSSLTGSKYYIAVHSSTNVNTTVACGNIQ